MAAYKGFARVYDLFMADIPYGKWAGYVLGCLKRYGVEPKGEGRGARLLELGCGTGNMSRYLCGAGYEVTGVDLSADMVRQALKKHIPGFRAYQGDMRLPFAPGDGYDAAVSLCDSMNYLLHLSDVELAMRAAGSKLKAGGIFLFDLKHEQFFCEELGDNIFADRRGGISYIWENSYDRTRRLNEYDITFYYRILGGLCKSFTEHHRQRAYSRSQIDRAACRAGFRVAECQRRGERDYYILIKAAIK